MQNKCNKCNRMITNHHDQFEHDGDILCPDCFTSMFSQCESCGVLIPEEDELIEHPDGYYLCGECARTKTLTLNKEQAKVLYNALAVYDNQVTALNGADVWGSLNLSEHVKIVRELRLEVNTINSAFADSEV